jgi:L-2-hydroxyglutarate oxidase LhgO
MKQESKKKLEKIIERGKKSFVQKEEIRPFKQLQKIEPQMMTIEERFSFLEESIEKMSFDSLIDTFDLMTDISMKTIANNQASRKLNEIILKLQKEMK